MPFGKKRVILKHFEDISNHLKFEKKIENTSYNILQVLLNVLYLLNSIQFFSHVPIIYKKVKSWSKGPRVPK
jgi:hypothetical protein